MAVSTLHKLDKITLPSSVEFSVIRNARYSAGIESLVERPAGHPHPMFRANLQQRPTVEFSTPQLDVLLAAIGAGGASLGASTTLYFKLGAATGSVARATAQHRKLTLASAFAYWSSIRLPHNGAGEASVMLNAVYDGTNDPFVYAGSQALSGNLAAGSFFGAGPVKINGVEIPGIKEITIESGVQLIQEGSGSELYDTFVGVETTAPVVTIRTLENVNWVTLGLNGTALNGSTGLAFWARKFDPLGSRVANATTEHILFTGLLGSALPVDSSGDGAAPISDTIRVELLSASDGVIPLTANTAAAIS